VQILGDSYKHRRGEPLPATSALFDGSSVRLRGVRGETLGIQVLHDDPFPTPHITSLSIAVPGVSVQPFQMDWIEVKSPSTGVYGPSRGAGWYPDRLAPAAAPVTSQHGSFFDVIITPEARPGRYQGTLRIDERAIPVSLDIESARIDLYPEPLVWVWYMPSELALAHGLEAESPQALALERRYSELFRAHGAFSLGAHKPEELRPREDFARGATYWPVLLDRSGDKARFQASVRAWIDYFRDRPEIPFAIPIDEPRTFARQLQVRTWSLWAREAGSGDDRLLFAVTDRPRPLYTTPPLLGNTIDAYISWHAVPPGKNAPRAHYWTYNGAPGHAGSMIIDTHGTALRTWGWIAYRYQVPLWYAWAGMYYRDVYNERGPSNVLIDPITFQDPEDHGNGDGLLAYPGALPSLRLKALRRGLQDRLLLQTLAACGGQARARALAGRMILRALGEARLGARPLWPISEPPWEAARYELLDAIATACPPA
jgi:hypothetical protein